MVEPRIAASARLSGEIKLGENVRIAQGCVLRSRAGGIEIGAESMVLENSVLIGTEEHKVVVGQKTVFGHKCLCIGASIGDLCEIGNGTIILPGAAVGDWCIFGEGTLVPSGTIIPSGSVVVGRPGRIIRSLSEADRVMISRMRGGDTDIHPGKNITHNFSVKERAAMGKTYSYRGKLPQIDGSAFVFDSAEITGDVQIGADTVIAAGVRIIGDSHGPVRIGTGVQILENTVLHLLPDNELIIEDNVTIGPGCIIHGTSIGAGSVVEAGAIVCDYSRLGSNVTVRAGSLVKQRAVVDDNHVVLGFPAQTVEVRTSVSPRPDWALQKGVDY